MVHNFVKLYHPDARHVKGRGLVLGVDTREYGGRTFSRGDIVLYEGLPHRVIDVECVSHFFGASPIVGLVVKKIEEEELKGERLMEKSNEVRVREAVERCGGPPPEDFTREQQVELVDMAIRNLTELRERLSGEGSTCRVNALVTQFRNKVPEYREGSPDPVRFNQVGPTVLELTVLEYEGSQADG